jgi:hypothetical protein
VAKIEIKRLVRPPLAQDAHRVARVFSAGLTVFVVAQMLLATVRRQSWAFGI